jgi:DNA primase
MDNSLKDNILEATDIVQLIGERVSLTKRGREYVGLCPFHPDRRPSLNVNPQKQIFKCFSCGAGGDAIRFVELYERVGFREALAALADRAGIALQNQASDGQSRQLREQLGQAITFARRHFRRNLCETPAGRATLAYARQRGLSDETIERYQLGLAANAPRDLLTAGQRAGLSTDTLLQAGLISRSDRGDLYDRFRNRLVFPISDQNGRPIAFGGRTLGDDRAKYLNSPESPLFSKSRVLYGWDLAREAIDVRREVIVVEGYMDAVLLAQHGFKNVVATLGTALTDAHAKLLRARADTLSLCFDGDAAGQRAADRAVAVALRTQVAVRVVLLEAGEDPADCVTRGGAEAFEARLKGSTDALEFKWSQTVRAFGQGGHQARRAATEDFLQFVAGAAVAGGVDPLQQNLLVGRLSDLLGVPAQEVFAALGRAKRTPRRTDAVVAASDLDASAYVSSVRGLPAALVTAGETILGLLLIQPVSWRWVDNSVAQGAAYSETWHRLYRVLLELHEDVGEYSIGQVMQRCDDAALCELLDRARARVSGVTSVEDEFLAARKRLASELELLEMSRVRAGLRAAGRGGDEDPDAFESLREMARGQAGVLPAESRWSLPSPG